MSNTLLIYNQLCAAGVSRAGALGLLGNWQAESSLEPGRLQNDFSANRIYSRSYTADVTAGRITRTQFARDQKGYGLAQWTYFNFSTGQGRKLELYDFWKKSGKALDDVSMQVSFALHELTTEAQYAGLWQLLRTTDDIWTATDKVCHLYEQPYYCNVDTRFRYATELDAEISSAETTAPTDSADLPATEEAPSAPNSTLHSALCTFHIPHSLSLKEEKRCVIIGLSSRPLSLQSAHGSATSWAEATACFMPCWC